MDNYADSYTGYRADLAYRHEQLVTGLAAGRSARRTRRSLRSMLTTATATRTGRVPGRTHFARSA